MLSPFERHPPLKRSLASCEWGRKWISPLCVGDTLRLVGLPKRFRLLLPFGQKSIAPMAHLGDKQCMEVFANLQESFRVADNQVAPDPPGIIYIFYMSEIWFGKKLVNYCKLHM